jgi:hypothetical protein
VEPTKRGIVQRIGHRRLRLPVRLPVDIVCPDPRSKMRFIQVKNGVHPILHARCDVLELGMRNPVLSSVFSQREALKTLVVDVIFQVEKKSETNLREDGVRGFEKNVKSGEVTG